MLMPKKLSTFFKETCPQTEATSRLVDVIEALAAIVAQVSVAIESAPLHNQLGKSDLFNVQDEQQAQLDVIANDYFVQGLQQCNAVAGVVSEELEDALFFECDDAYSIKNKKCHYLVAFDPLDGSSNIAVNVALGSIFSVLLAPNTPTLISSDFLQKGDQQKCAGYAIYGPSTLLVLTLGNGVHCFAYDRLSATFLLTHANMHVPVDAQEFAINTSNQRFWQPPMQRYIAECLAGAEGERGKNFNMRWVASMVADVHRILVRGGVYLYPQDNKQPLKAGRLRLLYEANPMSMIIEQANGTSSTGRQRLLDITPTHIHQRVPVIMGAKNEVNLIIDYHHVFDIAQTSI